MLPLQRGRGHGTSKGPERQTECHRLLVPPPILEVLLKEREILDGDRSNVSAMPLRLSFCLPACLSVFVCLPVCLYVVLPLKGLIQNSLLGVGRDQFIHMKREEVSDEVGGVGRSGAGERAETTFKGVKEPGNNFRCPPGGYNLMISTDTTFPAAEPPAAPTPGPLSTPSARPDDVRPSISQPDAGDDTDNLACEFSPASDMVLRLHAPVQLLHAKDRGENLLK